MQERANSSREPSLLPTTSDQRTPPISPHIDLKSAADVLATNAVLDTERKRPLSLWHLALSALSEDVHSPGFSKRCYDSELPPTKMKFLCSFGGKFLPRPSDGKLRYVGGYNHVLQLNKDISWREFSRRMRKLYSKFHTVKYQLPGENINLLISVSSDEDFHLMMDECSVLQDSEHKPQIFLFSSEDGDDDDGGGGVHSNVGKVDADSERRYVVAVNGLDGSCDAFSKRASASATEMDQLMLELEEVKKSKSASSSASVSAMDLITPLKTPSKPIQAKQRIGLPAHLKNQDSEEQFKEDDMYLCSGYRHQDFFFNKDSNVPFPPLVPTESTYPSKHKQGIRNLPKPLNELRTLPRIVNGLHGEMRIEDGEVPRKEIKAKEDSVSKKNDEAGLSWYFTDELPVPTKQLEGLTSDIVQVEPSNAASRVFQTEKIPREQAEPLIRLAKSDDLIGFQQLGLNEIYIMTQEPIGAAKSADPLPGEYLNSSDMLSLPAQVPENVMQSVNSKDFGDARVNQGEQISSSEEWERSHNFLPKRRSYGSQEDAASQVEKRTDGESYRKSFASQRKIEKSDQEIGVQTTVGSVELKLSPVGTKSCNRSQESPSSTSSPSTPSGNRTAKMCDKRAQCGSQDQDYSLLKVSVTRSQENDGSSLFVLSQSRELREDVRETNLEQEEYEAERAREIGLPAMDAISQDLNISNVQIIKNEDLEDLRELGAGTFGIVYHGKWRGTDVAIKRIKNSCFLYHSSQTDKLIFEFWREAGILSKLHHPNVMAFYGVVKDGPGGKLATVTEFMVSGSLKKVLLRRDKYLDRRKRLMLAMDAAIGMEYLHSKKIVHFDLKCDNLLVNLRDSSRPICKVADFGLSKMKQTTMVSGGMRGTLPWMAPELLTINSNKVSEKVDVYSFGVVMWEILTGEEPYGDMHYGAVIGGILNNTLRPTVPSSCDVDWRKLMEQCWAANPDQRPSFSQIAAQLRSMLDSGQS